MTATLGRSRCSYHHFDPNPNPSPTPNRNSYPDSNPNPNPNSQKSNPLPLYQADEMRAEVESDPNRAGPRTDLELPPSELRDEIATSTVSPGEIATSAISPAISGLEMQLAELRDEIASAQSRTMLQQQQVAEQLARYGEENAELRAEVRSATAPSVSVAKAARPDAWQEQMERLCMAHHGGERPFHGGDAARNLLRQRLERQVVLADMRAQYK